jgi:hypothetical protein
MAGLLDFFGNMDKRTQMGLLMAGAQMMNTPRQQGGLGAIGNGLLGFAQGLIDQQEKERTDSRLDRLDAIAARKSDAEINKDNATANYYNGGGKNADPYYTPIPTANGVYGFDNRSGKVQLAIDENGQPVIKSSDSVQLQSDLAAGRERGKTMNSIVDVPDPDSPTPTKMLGGAAFPELLQRPTDLSGLPQVKGNNYGNIRPIGANKGFQSFDTPEAGLAAIDQNLAAYGSKHGINTLGGVISRWSPPNENNTNALIANAAKVTGLDPNQPIDLSDPKIRAMITPAIVKQEHSIDITNPITKPTVLGMQMAAKNGVSPIEAIDKGVAIAEQSVNDLKQVQSAANTIYKGQSTKDKLALETGAKVDEQRKLDALKIESDKNVSVATKTDGANEVNRILMQAYPLLEKATGSDAGNLRDEAFRKFGKSTEGALAIAALKPLSAQLLAATPKAPGAQSDKELDTYKQATGDLSNPLVPSDQKMAAVNTILKFHEKWAENPMPKNNQPAPQANNSGWSIKRID